MTTPVNVCNEKADKAIRVMMSGVAVAALVPAHVNWTLMASAMGTGVVAIGYCYGIKLTKDEGWKLIKQFVLSAGFWFLSVNVGSKMLTAFMETTGLGYGVGVTIDVAISTAFAWAIGAASKEYFQREYLGKSKLSKEELGEIFRDAFREQKNKDKNK